MLMLTSGLNLGNLGVKCVGGILNNQELDRSFAFALKGDFIVAVVIL